MPPKPKFTKEEIVASALELVSEKGLCALTSRDLGARLGSSARPIFTVFNSMDEVVAAVKDAAIKRFESYSERVGGYTPYFKQVGMQMVLFSQNEPNLFKLGFMAGDNDTYRFDDMFLRLGDVAKRCISALCRDYELETEAAERLFEHVWLHTFGICVLCVTGMCRFSEAETEKMMGENFQAMLRFIKSGEK